MSINSQHTSSFDLSDLTFVQWATQSHYSRIMWYSYETLTFLRGLFPSQGSSRISDLQDATRFTITNRAKTQAIPTRPHIGPHSHCTHSNTKNLMLRTFSNNSISYEIPHALSNMCKWVMHSLRTQCIILLLCDLVLTNFILPYYEPIHEVWIYWDAL